MRWCRPERNMLNTRLLAPRSVTANKWFQQSQKIIRPWRLIGLNSSSIVILFAHIKLSDGKREQVSADYTKRTKNISGNWRSECSTTSRYQQKLPNIVLSYNVVLLECFCRTWKYPSLFLSLQFAFILSLEKYLIAQTEFGEIKIRDPGGGGTNGQQDALNNF